MLRVSNISCVAYMQLHAVHKHKHNQPNPFNKVHKIPLLLQVCIAFAGYYLSGEQNAKLFRIE